MANRISILQLGKGSVGGALIEQIREQHSAVRDHLGVDLGYAGIFGRATGTYDPRGIDLRRWREAAERGSGSEPSSAVAAAGREIADPKILVDATAADGMAAVHASALEGGFHVVSCNKKPLSGPLRDYERAHEASRACRRLYLYEVTVGAGLPILATLSALIASGDRVDSIEGCFSGTLNSLCAGLDRGERFSELLARARARGYTEPDPRDDLGGQDVARKALILARETGQPLEPDDVSLVPFCDTGWAADAEQFLATVSGLDAPLERRWRETMARGDRPRYVATVGSECSASLREVAAGSPLGRLAGPENVFVFKTRRYDDHPLVISGPGAGPQVTAAGAFGDILRVARVIAFGDGLKRG